LRGHKIQGIFGLTPVLDGFGLIIAAFSYNGLVTITATSNAKAMPDADLFARYIRESANELEEIITTQAAKASPRKEELLKSNAFFTDFKKFLTDQPSLKRKTTSLTYNFEVEKDGESIHYGFKIEAGKVTYRKRKILRPSVHIKIDDLSLHKLHKGEVYVDELRVQEKMKAKGKEKELSKFIELIKAFSASK
jgi:alkyl sulfatase BDS1-like metallo-beta-lactamase superfamily hydrolase